MRRVDGHETKDAGAVINVCYLVDAPFLGGAERYISRIALGLDRSEFRPSLVLRELEGNDGGIDGWAASLEADGVPVTRVAMGLPFRPWSAVGILRAIEHHAPHVAHVNMPGPYSGQMGLLAALARMGGAGAVVVTEHLPMVQRLWKRALVKRVAYRYVDAVLTVCRANVPYLVGPQSVPVGKVRVIPNALDGGYARPQVPSDRARRARGLPQGSVVVVYVGNILRHKGLHRAIQALSRLDRDDWHLLVIGTGPEEARCRERLRTLGLSERATFAGPLSPAEVAAALAGADVLTLPSTIEGMPYVVLEAMASGLPVVAGRVFGIPEMVEDGVHGFLVDPTDIDALSRALGRLIDDGALRARMGAAARRRFELEFTLERQVSEIENLYRELLGRTRAPIRGGRR